MSESRNPASSASNRTRQRVAVAIGLLVSLFFLYLAFQQLNPEAFISSLAGVSLPWLIVATGLFMLSVLVIALRWQFLLRALKFIALIPLFRLVMIGYMGNNVYPLRAGEALRIYLLRRDHDIPVTEGATTAVVERVFDGLVMLAFILLGLLASGMASPEIEAVVSVAMPVFALATLVFLVLAAQPRLLRKLVAQVAGLLPEAVGSLILKVADGIIAGLEALRSPVYLAGTVIASFVSWGIQVLVYWMVMWAFGFDTGWAVALLVVGVVNLAGLIPASPGQVGVYEFFASSVLIAAGIDPDQALAYAVVVHIVIWLPATLMGFFYLAQAGMGFKAVRDVQQTEAE